MLFSSYSKYGPEHGHWFFLDGVVKYLCQDIYLIYLIFPSDRGNGVF